jgi:hypothetical protein
VKPVVKPVDQAWNQSWRKLHFQSILSERTTGSNSINKCIFNLANTSRLCFISRTDFTNVSSVLVAQRRVQVIGGMERNILGRLYWCRLIVGWLIAEYVYTIVLRKEEGRTNVTQYIAVVSYFLLMILK